MLGRVPAPGDGDHKKLIEAAGLWARGLLISEGDHAKQDEAEREALAAFGLVLADEPRAVADHEFYLWPENVPAWELFMGVSTQWIFSFEGREGLNYDAVDRYVRVHVRRKHWRRRWAELQAMEHACLDAWAERRA